MDKRPHKSSIQVLQQEPSCAVCGCTEWRACEGGCFWAYKPKKDQPLVCSNCVYAGTRKPASISDRFPKDHKVVWIHRICLMGVLGPDATVVRTSERRIRIRLAEGKTEHWVTPRRLLDAEPFDGPAENALAA